VCPRSPPGTLPPRGHRRVRRRQRPRRDPVPVRGPAAARRRPPGPAGVRGGAAGCTGSGRRRMGYGVVRSRPEVRRVRGGRRGIGRSRARHRPADRTRTCVPAPSGGRSRTGSRPACPCRPRSGPGGASRRPAPRPASSAEAAAAASGAGVATGGAPGAPRRGEWGERERYAVSTIRLRRGSSPSVGRVAVQVRSARRTEPYSWPGPPTVLPRWTPQPRGPGGDAAPTSG
jgi:hypothetical protein